MDAEKENALAPGLYLVATPIGNLGDITLRALEVLRGADRIACEDTRQTQKLLNHFQIETPTESCHEFNEAARAAGFVEAIKGGARIAVVTDAGMPGISDPGVKLVQAAIAAGVPVVPVPGANAAVSALVGSGLPTEEWIFLGFLPEKAGARRTRLETLLEETAGTGRTLVFYEAPHRILETLADVETIFPAETRVVAARELTKVHEEFLRGTAQEIRAALRERDRVRGEFTLLIEAAPAKRPAAAGMHAGAQKIGDQIAALQASEGLDEKDALKRLARELGKAKSELYRDLQRERANRR
jgi:16S rRNA (cytidine1402-2'-O)-methyltransferase